MAKSESSAQPFKLVEVGEPAPAFNLKDQDGKPHTLQDYAGRWLALYFYPKDDTPGCTKQACSFRDSDQRLRDAGVAVLGVSPDDVASHEKFASKFSLKFPLLADEGHHVCDRYGVWQEKSMYGRKYMGVARITYLIDPQGKVAHRWDKVKTAEHADEVLAEVERRR